MDLKKSHFLSSRQLDLPFLFFLKENLSKTLTPRDTMIKNKNLSCGAGSVPVLHHGNVCPDLQ